MLVKKQIAKLFLLFQAINILIMFVIYQPFRKIWIRGKKLNENELLWKVCYFILFARAKPIENLSVCVREKEKRQIHHIINRIVNLFPLDLVGLDGVCVCALPSKSEMSMK